MRFMVLVPGSAESVAGAGRAPRRAGAARRSGPRTLGPPARAARPGRAAARRGAQRRAFGPQAGLELVDSLADEPALRGYHLLPSVRGDLLVRLGRLAQAREEFVRAADQCDNDPERELLLSRAVACGT